MATWEEPCFLTPIGGLAVKMIAGETLVRGESLQVWTADGKVVKNAIDSDMPIGTVYDVSVAQDSEVWVTVAGIGYAKPEDAVTAARGYIIYSSNATAGRVDQDASLPAVAAHNRELGHFIENGSGNGAVAKAIIHLN